MPLKERHFDSGKSDTLTAKKRHFDSDSFLSATRY